MDIKYASYQYKDSPDYRRYFATNYHTLLNTHGDLIIDFSEEYMNPVVVTKEYLDKSQENELSHDYEELKLTREKKCTIVMNGKQALNMAYWIINAYNSGGSGGDNSESS